MSNEQHGLSDCKVCGLHSPVSLCTYVSRPDTCEQALRQLADEIAPGSPLAEDAPIKEFRKLQANSIVFK